MSRLFPVALLTAGCLALPGKAAAEITHSYEARFGVSYTDDPNAPRGGLQSLYEGRFTTTIEHETDSGMRFRFDIGVVVGNLDPDRPGYPSDPFPRQR